MFYMLATVLLLVGVVIEYFKLPIGGYPGLTELVGRAAIAAILLCAYPEITNTISDITDAVAGRIGDFNEFHRVLTQMGDKLGELSWSWTSVKDSLILVFSFITFFLLYISVYIAQAGIVFVWILLYIFSPVLIAFFILPATASITKTLFRSLMEVCAWKIVWAVLAALLWSSALGHMNDAGSKLNFLTVIAFNLILAISLLLTPIVVNALVSKGLTQTASGWMGLAASAAAFSPGVLAKATAVKGMRAGREATSASINRFKEEYFSDNDNDHDSPKKRKPRTAKMPDEPTWLKDSPPVAEPPGWMGSRLENDKSHEKK